MVDCQHSPGRALDCADAGGVAGPTDGTDHVRIAALQWMRLSRRQGSGPSLERRMTDASATVDQRQRLLALHTETKRLERATVLAARVQLQIDSPDLYVAAVSSYNVVIDTLARRILHGCRDFLGQARRGMLCKHVAGLLLCLPQEQAVKILQGLGEENTGWRLEVIASRGRRG